MPELGLLALELDLDLVLRRAEHAFPQAAALVALVSFAGELAAARVVVGDVREGAATGGEEDATAGFVGAGGVVGGVVLALGCETCQRS